MSTSVRSTVELADGGSLALQTWPNSGRPPVLALHGWLDNSASFDFLAPLLSDYHVIAPDLAGHGLSSHRSPDSAYNIWQDLAEVDDLRARLDLDTFVLVGHSRGAIISTLYAAVFPEQIRALVLLDGLMPDPVAGEDAPVQLRAAIDDRRRYREKPRRFYHSYEDALRARLRGPLKLSRKAVSAIAARGIAQSEQGYFWRDDPRLRGASEFKLSKDQAHAFVRGIQCPTLLLVAGVSVPEYYQNLIAGIDNITAEVVAGSHHLHMEESRVNVATKITEFLSARLADTEVREGRETRSGSPDLF